MQEKEKKQFIERIYHKFWKELYAVAYRRLRSEEDVEDMLQDIFLSMLTGNYQLVNDDSVRALLHQRLKDRTINFYRRQLTRLTFEVQESFKDELSDLDSESRLMNRELEIVVQEEIDRMPEKMKEIFLLSRNELLTSEEIAIKLDLSSQTVRNQISSGIKRIRTTLALYGNADISPASLNVILILGALLLSSH